MNEKQLKRLIENYLNGNCTEREKTLLDKVLDSYDSPADITQPLEDEHRLTKRNILQDHIGNRRGHLQSTAISGQEAFELPMACSSGHYPGTYRYGICIFLGTAPKAGPVTSNRNTEFGHRLGAAQHHHVERWHNHYLERRQSTPLSKNF